MSRSSLLTYRELLNQLQNLTSEQLDQSVTVFQEEMDEYWGVSDTDFTIGSDIIDDDHFILCF